jgi:hypothetical protein
VGTIAAAQIASRGYLDLVDLLEWDFHTRFFLRDARAIRLRMRRCRQRKSKARALPMR